MKNKNGITLIAMVITVVVMIILAGVTIYVSTSNNSVVENADKSVYLNSITQIEELLNTLYNEHYNEIEELNLHYLDPGDDGKNDDTPITKARGLAYYLENSDEVGPDKNFFGKVFNGFAYYTNHSFKYDKFAYVSSDGRVFYMLSYNKLKEYDPSLTIAKMNEPSDRTGTEDLDYLYCVTGDLEVFVIKEDMEHILGIDLDDLSYYDLNSVIYEAGSDWAHILGSENDVSYQGGQSHKSLAIDFSSVNVSQNYNFSGIGELKHLKSLTIKNVTAGKISNINGLAESAETLTYLWIENSSLGDCTALKHLTNLNYLFLYDMKQDDVDTILAAMQTANYTQLITIGIIGKDGYNDYAQGCTDERYYGTKRNKVNNIAALGNLTQATKNAVTTIFLTANNITSLEPLSKFYNLVQIRADSNKITSLNGLGNKANLQIIRLANNNLTNLNDISDVPKLYFLDVRKNFEITDISNVANLGGLTKLFFTSESKYNRNDSDVGMPDANVVAQKTKLLSIDNLQIDPKYAKLLVDNSSTVKLELVGDIDVDLFRSYKNCTALKKLSLNNVKFKSGNSYLNDAQSNLLLNEVLSDNHLSTVEYLQIINMTTRLTDASFLSNFANVLEVDFRNNSATNIGVLKNTAIKKLSIDNNSISLSSADMQAIINKLEYSTTYAYWTRGAGLVLCNNELYKQLKNCTSLTRLYMYRDWTSSIGAVGAVYNSATDKNEGITVDLTNCTLLTSFKVYDVYCNFILPPNVTYVEYGHIYSGDKVQYNTNGGEAQRINVTGFENMGLDFKNCKALNQLYIYTMCSPMPRKIFENLDNTCPKKTTLTKVTFKDPTSNSGTDFEYLSLLKNFKKVTNLEVYAESTNRYMWLNTLQPITEIESLTRLKIAYSNKLCDMPEDMSKLSNLKTLIINNCQIQEIPDDCLRKIPTIETIQMNNNRITNLIGLVPKKDSEFTNLKKLELQNNALENYFSVGAITYDIENQIFVPLYQRSLRTLLVQGNQFNGFNNIPRLTWTDLQY